MQNFLWKVQTIYRFGSFVFVDEVKTIWNSLSNMKTLFGE